MDAATLTPVPDRIDRGASYLPSAGGPSAVASASPAAVKSACSEIPSGDKGFGWDAPTAAINSGKDLPKEMLGPSNKISNGQGKQYDGQPDNDEDDVVLEAKELASAGARAKEPFHADNE